MHSGRVEGQQQVKMCVQVLAMMMTMTLMLMLMPMPMMLMHKEGQKRGSEALPLAAAGCMAAGEVQGIVREGVHGGGRARERERLSLLPRMAACEDRWREEGMKMWV